MHIGKGYVTSKGAQKLVGSDKGTAQLYVEIAGQRIKHTHVFENCDDAVDALEAMMFDMRQGLAQTIPVPPEA